MEYNPIPTTAQTPVSSFKTYEEAHSSMTVYLHDLVRFLGSLQVTPPRVEEHNALAARHVAWSHAFSNLLEQGSGASDSDVAKLQIWRIVVDMTIELDLCELYHFPNTRQFAARSNNLYFEDVCEFHVSNALVMTVLQAHSRSILHNNPLPVHIYLESG